MAPTRAEIRDAVRTTLQRGASSSVGAWDRAFRVLLAPVPNLLAETSEAAHPPPSDPMKPVSTHTICRDLHNRCDLANIACDEAMEERFVRVMLKHDVTEQEWSCAVAALWTTPITPGALLCLAMDFRRRDIKAATPTTKTPGTRVRGEQPTPPPTLWDLLASACARGGLTLTQARAMTEAQLREIYVAPDQSGGRFTITLDQAFGPRANPPTPE